MEKDKKVKIFGKNFTSPNNHKQENNGLIKFFGIFFILLGIAAFVNTLLIGNPASILWFCYLGIFLIGVGMLWKNSVLIMSQLNILFIPLLIWTSDFLYLVITGTSILGIADYFFNPSFPIISRLISTQHIFTIPVSLFILKKIKSKKIKYAWVASFIQLILVFIITITLTSAEDNINCVYQSCGNLYLGPTRFYPLVWFATGFVLIILTNFLISKIVNTKEIKK